MSFPHKRLDVYAVALNFALRADNIAHALPPGRGTLSDQLLRASLSILLNIAEGCGEFSGPDKARFFRMARRSAAECSAIADHLGNLALISAADVQACDEMLERIASMLTGMVKVAESKSRSRAGSKKSL